MSNVVVTKVKTLRGADSLNAAIMRARNPNFGAILAVAESKMLIADDPGYKDIRLRELHGMKAQCKARYEVGIREQRREIEPRVAEAKSKLEALTQLCRRQEELQSRCEDTNIRNTVTAAVTAFVILTTALSFFTGIVWAILISIAVEAVAGIIMYNTGLTFAEIQYSILSRMKGIKGSPQGTQFDMRGCRQIIDELNSRLELYTRNYENEIEACNDEINELNRDAGINGDRHSAGTANSRRCAQTGGNSGIPSL
jgi:hypothetical protein